MKEATNIVLRIKINRDEYPDVTADLEHHCTDIPARVRFLIRKGLEATTKIGISSSSESAPSSRGADFNSRGDATMEQLGLNVADFMIVRGDKQS